MRTFEVKLSTGKRHVWEGRDGVDACQSYADSHPGVTVVAWRHYPHHGLFVWGGAEIIEPGHWRYGRGDS
jgi:hypothetical protein